MYNSSFLFIIYHNCINNSNILHTSFLLEYCCNYIYLTIIIIIVYLLFIQFLFTNCTFALHSFAWTRETFFPFSYIFVIIYNYIFAFSWKIRLDQLLIDLKTRDRRKLMPQITVHYCLSTNFFFCLFFKYIVCICYII